MKIKRFLMLLTVQIVLISSPCFSQELFSPPEASFTVDTSSIAKLCGPNKELFWRYLVGNPRWLTLMEYDMTSSMNHMLSIRMEDTKDVFADAKGYQPSLNGYYSRHNPHLQTRVLFSYRAPYGNKFNKDSVTEVEVKPTGTVKVKPVLMKGYADSPSGDSSHVIFKTACNISLEIFEEQKPLERTFTKNVVQEISQEIEAVLAHKKEVETTGRFADKRWYPMEVPNEEKIEVTDGIQPGIYIINGWLKQKTPAQAIVRVFRESDNKEVFNRRKGDESLRYIGYDAAGKSLNRFATEVTISEGDWSKEYKARFEIWVTDYDGKKRKALETSRMINGWQR